MVQVEAEKEKKQDVWPKMRRLAATASTIADLNCIRAEEKTGLEVVAVELDWGKNKILHLCTWLICVIL